MEEDRTVQRASVKVSYKVLYGRKLALGSICLLASTGRGPKDFLHLAEALVNFGFRVILPWPRGTGQSTGEQSDPSFHDFAADVAALLTEERNEGPVIVAGHAFGCWIARTLAADQPELVDALVFLAAAAETWPSELSDAINTAMAPDVAEVERLAALRLAFFAAGNDPRPWLKGWYPELALLQRKARELTDRQNWWSSGHAPILDVVGTDDPFRPPEKMDFYQKEFGKRVELRTVEGASHALPDEKPKETAEIIYAWAKNHLQWEVKDP